MINVTEVAAENIKTKIHKRGKGLGIRIGVKTTGCSGLAYILEFVDNPTQTDIEYTDKGCSVFVDKKSLPYIDGLTIDFVKKGLNEGFEFKNPLEKDRCGCGESFRV